MSAQAMSVNGEIHARVARVLVETLNLDEGDVTPGATLRGDLGAEAIDFPDMVFRLERQFGIQIPRSELFPDASFRGASDFAQDGGVTDKALAEPRARMPFADPTDFEGHRRSSSLPDLLTAAL